MPVINGKRKHRNKRKNKKNKNSKQNGKQRKAKQRSQMKKDKRNKTMQCDDDFKGNSKENEYSNKARNQNQEFKSYLTKSKQSKVWNRFYQDIKHRNKSELQTLFPKEGRTKDEAQDFMLIHAAATVLSPAALAEIESMNNCVNLQLYRKNITYLHYFALNGSVETVKFLVEHGMNVNCVADGKTTALDYCFQGLAFWQNNSNNVVIYEVNGITNDGRRRRIEKAIQTLKKIGGKKGNEMFIAPRKRNTFLRKKLSDATGIDAGLLLESMGQRHHTGNSHLDPRIEAMFGEYNPFDQLEKLSKSQLSDIINGKH
eukprot:47946_1